MGAVNIFLGGTGKYIAEDIQDTLDFYGNLQIGEPIAFDLNTSDSQHSNVILRGLITADPKMNQQVPQLAKQWQSLSPGAHLSPDGKPGPELTPEHSILHEIGDGIASNPTPNQGLYALRAHGLAVFALLFDQRLTQAGTGAGNQLRNQIETAIRNPNHGGKWPRINLLTSTAGGTGAGMVIPLSLWLRKHYPNCELTLIAVTPSAFDSVLKGAPDLVGLAAKAKSGTYAILRELSFLHDVDPSSRFSLRALPVTVGGLEYRPGDRVFARVIWFGGREQQSPRDAFEEAGTLLRVLSDDQAADDLASQVGAIPMQAIGSITSIEYPKLRLQRRIVSDVLIKGYERLRLASTVPVGGARPAESVHLLDYAERGEGRVLASWLHSGATGPFAPQHKATRLSEEATSGLADAIKDEAKVGGWGSIQRGTNVQRGIYESGEQIWQAYTVRIVRDVGNLAADNQRRITSTIQRLRNDEESAFNEWLRSDVVEPRLSGSTGIRNSTQEVLGILAGLEQEAHELDQLFGSDSLIPGPTLASVESDRLSKEGLFTRPGKQEVRTTLTDQVLSVVAGLAAGAAIWAVAEQIQAFSLGGLSSEILSYLAIIMAAGLAARATLWTRLRRRHEAASEPFRRRRAEDDLFALMEQQDGLRCVHWLHSELRNTGSRPAFFEEIRQQVRAMRSAVEDLDRLYDDLLNAAQAESRALTGKPAHVAQEVGDCIITNPALIDQVVPEVLERLRIEAHADVNRRAVPLRVKFVHTSTQDQEHFQAASGSVRDMLNALAGVDDDQKDIRADQLRGVRAAAWSLVNWKLGTALPADFQAALLFCSDDNQAKATETLAQKLAMTARMLPRPPSVALSGKAVAPRNRRLYAGSHQILAEFQLALGDATLTGGERRNLMEYAASARVVHSLGEHLVFFDLWALEDGASWAPHVISDTEEARQALATYYGASPGVDPDCTAQQTCFTVFPELLAATKVEVGGVVKPLAPIVSARLLGSDLDAEGPTFVELFYMLRHRKQLTVGVEGSGPTARLVTRLLIGGASVRLLSKSPGGLNDTGFGGARNEIVDFDVLTDFLRFDGTPILPGSPANVTRDTAVDVHVDEWATHSDLAGLQRAIIHGWYEGSEDEPSHWLAVAMQDVAKMPANGLRADWERVVRALVNSGRRRAIRGRWLTKT